MSAVMVPDDIPSTAAERSAYYAVLSRAFTYEGSEHGPLAIPGPVFDEAFEPSIGAEACSLRESTYVDGDVSALFEELMRFYSFFGLGRGEQASMPDHLSVELEFMHYLTHLEDRADGDADALASLARAERDFLTRHVGRLVGGIKSSLASRDPRCVELVETAAAFIDEEIARFGANGQRHDGRRS